ncbi:MAG TPA: arsenite efflux transporter metallochaperone ArsD [Bacillales bacterium]|nr:arsenite efflux transporter metallochaperone ArsD [Bacillales bacterium]
MKLEVFDPAMCCPTGVCGPNVDSELVRVASALFLLKEKGCSITRYNLGSEVQAFISNQKVNQLLNEKGPEVLPIIVLDGKVVKEGTYPTNEELANWFQIDTKELEPKKSKNQLL